MFKIMRVHKYMCACVCVCVCVCMRLCTHACVRMAHVAHVVDS